MPKFEGTTVEEATSSGLQELNLTKEHAKVTVISEGKKGFLGFGKKLAVIEMSALENNSIINPILSTDVTAQSIVKEDKTMNYQDESYQQAIDNLSDYLITIISEMGETATVTTERQHKKVVFTIETTNPGLIIGKHGRTLNGLQYLAQIFIHRTTAHKIAVIVDVGDYRLRREEKLKRIAQQTIKEVQAYRQPIFLDPMPSFERKQIHAYLADYDNIVTHSEGEEPFRYLVVDYQKDSLI